MSVLFAMFLSFNVAFAADNNDKAEVATPEKAAMEVVVTENETVEGETEKKASPEGVYYKVQKIDGTTISCWFCNCSKL